jgi:pyruvoyl-dependent arginine decarboxylase (PvlArgDC)
MARNETNEPSRLISVSMGFAIPVAHKQHYG